ncbi:filamentation induced by cAMP protein Fic [Chthoniobacter flavus Ellin428]|uniref:Filamentation induced by cAMP protein Fic n=1 Tax=Chthoniobacter flavus Ellin428 TaxID=497964 RepID=B4D8I8_9BACT|nr:Fic/DOC family N-terminal domain-containing protein [Chthoniobacter flavus]EDY17210.1 filamentation induced by cAMP protein Fic [Chthoniobacter flavus Ellin428]TCO86964.1 Fic family protein [Chthoniobacter flavus]
MTFDPEEPHNALPLLPPPVELETKAVLKRCVAANKALAELKGTGDLIPNQSVLINVIPLQEAKLSSEIENIVTTQDALFTAALDESRATDLATKEVLRYRTALRRGFETIQAQPLRLHLMEDLCSVLRDEKVSFRGDEEIMIGNPVTKAITYTPPLGPDVIQAKLRNLEDFLLSTEGDLDPLVRMAVAHYQFEAIHPFTDGNGRTGRILNILFLIHAGLLRIPVLYLSRHLIQHKAEYYRLLRGVTERGEWEPWILFLLTGVEETATWTTGRILAVRDLFDETLALCRAKLPSKVYSKELVELIFAQPYSKISFLVEAGIAQRQTASEYLQALEGLGILKGEKRGREVLYRHPALVKVLTA